MIRTKIKYVDLTEDMFTNGDVVHTNLVCVDFHDKLVMVKEKVGVRDLYSHMCELWRDGVEKYLFPFEPVAVEWIVTKDGYRFSGSTVDMYRGEGMTREEYKQDGVYES